MQIYYRLVCLFFYVTFLTPSYAASGTGPSPEPVPSPPVGTRTIILRPGADIESLAREAPEGTIFRLAAGTYRLQSITPKNNDIFISDGGAILNGSKLLKMNPDSGYWSAVEARASWGPGDNCLKDHPLCWILNDVFIDNVLQQPVANLNDLGPGKWFYDDANGKVFIGVDPTGHQVEFSSLSAAFSGTATGVKISNLTIEKYASPPQHGAIGGYAGAAQGWTIADVDAHQNHGTGIQVGPGSSVINCKINSNGQKGLGVYGGAAVVEGNEIAYNNYAGYDPGWEAGGTKFAKTDGLVVRSNFVHDNMGGGLWTDIENINVLIEKNNVVNNQGQGIRHEISYDAKIVNNTLKGNQGGIVIAISKNVEIYGNFVDVPIDGIDGITIEGGQRGVYTAHDINIHDNSITYQGSKSRSGLNGPPGLSSNIKFDSDDYYLAAWDDLHFIWGNMINLDQMQNLGQELHAKVTLGSLPPGGMISNEILPSFKQPEN